MPHRYAGKNRLAARFTVFDVAAMNNTLYPGWDYSGPNSYICSVILLLYFVPEIRHSMLNSQLKNVESITLGKKASKTADGKNIIAPFPFVITSICSNLNSFPLLLSPVSLCTELGFLFHQIETLASHSMVYPKPPGESKDPCKTILGAFVPLNFLSAFSIMPEAAALALLDGHPAATEVERRPEAFYRFLLHHLDNELNDVKKQGNKGSSKQAKGRKKSNLIDSIFGMNALSMNEFVNDGAGTESISLTRSNTVDLAYDAFADKSEDNPSLPDFGDVLRFSLCKDVPLRAWCHSTKAYETVIQRKIITSLPKILSLSCACAGPNALDRLPIWRKTDGSNDHWLPEKIEVEIEETGNVVTRQCQGKDWKVYKGEGLPKRITEKIKQSSPDGENGPTRLKYQLQAVLTFINNNTGSNTKDQRGHHILHIRVPKSHERQTLMKQMDITQNHLKSTIADASQQHLTLTRDVTVEDLERRVKTIQDKLNVLDQDGPTDQWVLFNGPNVSLTNIDDALAFHVSFKEPCILLYQQLEVTCNEASSTSLPTVQIPRGVMKVGKLFVLSHLVVS